MMAEWHIYASGPKKNLDGQKFWRRDGIPKGQTKVRKTISEPKKFSSDTGLLTYLGAWMSQDMRMEI